MKAYLHIGAPKTGTSALQAALARHQDDLATRAGILYPVSETGIEKRAARGAFTSGNATLLGAFLNPGQARQVPTRDEVEDWLRRCAEIADGRDLLLSSESMAGARPAEARELLSLLRGLGYRPVIVFYVRHLLDFAVSEYLQLLKAGFPRAAKVGRVPDGLGSFLSERRVNFLSNLRVFGHPNSDIDVVVRIYEEERAGLVERFFSIFTDDLVPDPAPPGIAEVNRSLSPEEAVLFERLARLPDGRRLCAAMLQAVISTPKPAGSRLRHHVDEAAYAMFADNNGPLVDQFNRAIFGGESRLRLASDRIVIGDAPHIEVSALLDAIVPSIAELVRRTAPDPAARRAAAAASTAAAADKV